MLSLSLTTGVILIILLSHFLADFVCQTDKMAKRKSTSLYWLGLHVFVYTCALAPAMLIFNSLSIGVLWLTINSGLHFVTDFFTSKATKYLWEKGDVHNFFVVIGVDQTIHYACLLLTAAWFLR